MNHHNGTTLLDWSFLDTQHRFLEFQGTNLLRICLPCLVSHRDGFLVQSISLLLKSIN